MRNLLTVCLLIFLAACAPKYGFLNTQTLADQKINRVLLVLDYLSVVDDVGKYWDFDENKNIQNLEYFETQIRKIIQQNGFSISDSFILSSGMLLSANTRLEHYLDGTLQDELIAPPFLYLAENIADDQAQYHVELFKLLINQYATLPTGSDNHKFYQNINFSYSVQQINIPDDTALLYVKISAPKVGGGKMFGVALLTAALSVAASNNQFVSVSILHGAPGSSAFLIHKGSGDLLWKNHIKSIDKKQGNDNSLFQNFPVNQ